MSQGRVMRSEYSEGREAWAEVPVISLTPAEEVLVQKKLPQAVDEWPWEVVGEVA